MIAEKGLDSCEYVDLLISDKAKIDQLEEDAVDEVIDLLKVADFVIFESQDKYIGSLEGNKENYVR